MTRMKYSGIEWIGQIPEEWELKTIKYIFDTISSGTTPDSSKPEFYNGDINWIQSGDLYKKDFVDSVSKTITEHGYRSSASLKIYDAPFLAIAMYGASIGNLAISRIDACVNQAVAVLKGDKDTVRFSKYALETSKDELIVAAQGGTQPNISQVMIKNWLLPLPSRLEIVKIADFLDKKVAQLDRAKSLLEEQIQKLEDYRQSLIYETVTKGLDKTVPMKDSGVDWIGQVPEISSIKKLKNLLATPLQYGANESGVDYDESLPRYIRITDIDSNGILKVDGKQSLGEKEAAPYILEDGNLLFARSGATVGKTFLYKSEFGRSAFAGYLIKANLNQNVVLPEYLYYYTQSSLFNTWKEMTFVQSTIQNIGADKYNVLPVLVYPIDEQKRMISYLDSKTSKLNQLITIKQKQIANINQQRQTLIYDYVTGKRRV